MRSDFEERREARIDRLEERAGKASRESDAAFKRADNIASFIPMGQPILVGHHSEKRHRRDIDKIHTNMRKGIDQADYAKSLERRAEAARNNTAIFSDDPNATEKLADKIDRLGKRQEMMKKANSLVRKKDIEGLLNMGFSETQVNELLKPDFCGRIGFASYMLQNNNANIRRLKLRLVDLQRQTEAVTEEIIIGEVKIIQNVEENRTQVFFPGKPDDETRAMLKRYGFRWAPSVGAWQRHLSSTAKYYAEKIVKGEF